jgi:penicillin-binding protein-related factor A (putative recombinase)
MLDYIDKNKTKSIDYQDIEKHCKSLPIIYPGIINFLQT